MLDNHYAAAIHFGSGPNKDDFAFRCNFTLSSTESNGINPPNEPVTFQVGTFTTTIPPRSFTKHADRSFRFAGVIHGVRLQARIRPTGTLRYAVEVLGRGASLAGSQNPIQVSLIIGNDSGRTSIRATNLVVAQQ